MIDGTKRAELLKRLEHAINCLSLENESDTPDWILARYLVGCLDVFDSTVRAREEWYGRRAAPSEATSEDPKR